MNTKRQSTGYNPRNYINYLQSDEYHIQAYRNPETIQKEEIMDSFMEFIADEFELSQDELSDIQALVNEFVGYDIKKAEQGEQKLLARWIESVE